MSNEKRKEERPEAYPKPTKTDKQLDNQDEFIQPQTEKKISEKPVVKDEESKRESSSAKTNFKAK